MAGGFESLGILPEIVRAVTELGWHLPTDVQDEAIPLILGGGDIMVAAETGSGKTAAYCIPLIQGCVETLRLQPKESPNEKCSSSVEISLSQWDRDLTLQLSADKLSSLNSAAAAQWMGARASHGLKAPGKYYYEVRVSGPGIARLGWSTSEGNLDLGKDSAGFGFGSTAKRAHNNKFEDYGVVFGDEDVVGCCLDFDEGTISYAVNGKEQGVAYTLPSSMRSSAALFPAVCMKGADVHLNFGMTPFQYTPPRGFTAVALAPSACLSAGNPAPRGPIAIIVVPIKDLAEQVSQEILFLSQYITDVSLRIMVLIGGGAAEKQNKMLAQGVDIIVCTPHKASEAVKAGQLRLSNVRFLILDEADGLISDIGALKQVISLYNSCPLQGSGDQRLQVCFFSATLHSPAITQLAQNICMNATWVDLKGPNSIPEHVHHVIYRMDLVRDSANVGELSTGEVPKTDGIYDVFTSKLSPADEKSLQIKRLKPHLLVKIIEKFEMSQCMVFCRTNLDCENLATFLKSFEGGSHSSDKKGRDSSEHGKFSCAVLGGTKSMAERQAALEAFKSGTTRVLLCTDVAARGIDVRGLPYVVNYTLPDEPESYIHRIGRVGRAEHLGLAISLIAPKGVEERVWYHTCPKKGRGCKNIELIKKGGCTMWLDEGEFFDSIQCRLDLSIPELLADGSLPPSLVALGVSYGEKVEILDTPLTVHSSDIFSAVHELATMEVEAQNIFLSFQIKFPCS